ncbi:MAG: lipase maturation factor family protein [Myxococcales bacterium]|nr:lipase maturation factor family protein [Myxococcales bacterium]
MAEPTTTSDRPALLFDADCGFCRQFIARWQVRTGDAVRYVESQRRADDDAPLSAEQRAALDELPAERFDASVVLVEPGGRVYFAAEAVFRALSHAPRRAAVGLALYRYLPGFAAVSEATYGFIARRRRFASMLTRLLWGRVAEPSRHVLVRALFVRALALVHIVALVSLAVQIDGLVGERGIAPAQQLMRWVSARPDLGFFDFPTLGWLFGASDGALTAMIAIGLVAALLCLVGVAQPLCLALMWLAYLSLCSLCRMFLAFQWDVLLLEATLLALFVAPWTLRPRLPKNEPPPRALGLWLVTWLLFRLIFASGVVKLSSGDASWANLTAMTYHYQTQPLPGPLSAFMHHLPLWLHKGEAVLMFCIELGLPLLLFAPRRLRALGALGIVGLMLLINVTGNYGFFGLLTCTLCLICFDDQMLPRRLVQLLGGHAAPPAPPRVDDLAEPPLWRRAARHASTTLAVALLVLSLIPLLGAFRARLSPQNPMQSIYRKLRALRSINGYGLFAVMTTKRPEITIEGSDDGGKSWRPYRFRYKPGDVTRRPPWLSLHMPRLDWQLWFAALRGRSAWVRSLLVRIQRGSPAVLDLFAQNPFPRAPPKAVRAVLWDYHFDPARAKTGNWWRRERLRVYARVGR